DTFFDRHLFFLRRFFLHTLAVWLVLHPFFLRAASRENAEYLALIQIRNLLVLLEPGTGLVPKGVAVTNWSQLREYNPYNDPFYLDRINYQLDLKHSPDCPLEAHYVFIQNQKLPMPGVKAHIVLIRFTPLRRPGDGRSSLGRFVVFRMDDGSAWAVAWLSEAEVQQTLAQVSLTIPAPDRAVIGVAEAGLDRFSLKKRREREDLDRTRIQYFLKSVGSRWWVEITWVSMLSSAVFIFIFLGWRVVKRKRH
ncbi:MAG TPA: hypothetical protein VKA67_09395, partial [Verrucomicrobiae bacterium]|nr:hypothetical protein [Verrucomicrobiae bacterium]